MIKRRIDVDFSHKCGRVKSAFGVVNGPFFDREGELDFFCDYQSLSVPAVRLADAYHDSYGFVDIHNIFPDMSLDERFELSYNFTEADMLMLSVKKLGADIVLRLGESPECRGVKRFTKLSVHTEKWAGICEKIIAHYNEGFAGGYKLGIKRVEIMSSPDNGGFAGSSNDYFNLYRTVALKLKTRFPRIRVGAYSMGGFRSLNHVDVSDAEGSYVLYLEEFLSYIRGKQTAAPLDFLSWKCCAETPEELALHANYARSYLSHYGFKRTESIISEFSIAESFGGGVPDKEYPALLASCLITAQKSDISMMFLTDMHPYSKKNPFYTLDDRVTKRYYAPYYVMHAFGELYGEKSTAVEISEDYRHEIYSIATVQGDKGHIIVAARDYDGVLEIVPTGHSYSTYSIEGMLGGGERGAGFRTQADGIELGSKIVLRTGKHEVYHITLKT